MEAEPMDVDPPSGSVPSGPDPFSSQPPEGSYIVETFTKVTGPDGQQVNYGTRVIHPPKSDTAPQPEPAGPPGAPAPPLPVPGPSLGEPFAAPGPIPFPAAVHMPAFKDTAPLSGLQVGLGVSSLGGEGPAGPSASGQQTTGPTGHQLPPSVAPFVSAPGPAAQPAPQASTPLQSPSQPSPASPAAAPQPQQDTSQASPSQTRPAPGPPPGPSMPPPQLPEWSEHNIEMQPTPAAQAQAQPSQEPAQTQDQPFQPQPTPHQVSSPGAGEPQAKDRGTGAMPPSQGPAAASGGPDVGVSAGVAPPNSSDVSEEQTQGQQASPPPNPNQPPAGEMRRPEGAGQGAVDGALAQGQALGSSGAGSQAEAGAPLGSTQAQPATPSAPNAAAPTPAFTASGSAPTPAAAGTAAAAGADGPGLGGLQGLRPRTMSDPYGQEMGAIRVIGGARPGQLPPGGVQGLGGASAEAAAGNPGNAAGAPGAQVQRADAPQPTAVPGAVAENQGYRGAAGPGAASSPSGPSPGPSGPSGAVPEEGGKEETGQGALAGESMDI